MPIMIPITDLLGLERQVAVLAFQYGDSLTNSIIPTSSALMAYLAVAGIPYEKWIKFIWKMILGWALIACLALILCGSIRNILKYKKLWMLSSSALLLIHLVH